MNYFFFDVRIPPSITQESLFFACAIHWRSHFPTRAKTLLVKVLTDMKRLAIRKRHINDSPIGTVYSGRAVQVNTSSR